MAQCAFLMHCETNEIIKTTTKKRSTFSSLISYGKKVLFNNGHHQVIQENPLGIKYLT